MFLEKSNVDDSAPILVETRNHVEEGQFGPTIGPEDAIDAALAVAAQKAAIAGEWTIVKQLVREIEERRLRRKPA